MQANAEAKTQANASKRGQTWTNANKRLHPPFLCFFTPPFAIPLLIPVRFSRIDLRGRSNLVWAPCRDRSSIFVSSGVLVPTVPQGQKDRGTTLGESRGPPQRPAEPRGTLEEAPAEAPKNPLRGKFPRRASRRVVPPGMVTLRNFKLCGRTDAYEHGIRGDTCAHYGFNSWCTATGDRQRELRMHSETQRSTGHVYCELVCISDPS